MKEQFICDVVKGLEAENKSLSSKYFYDKKGDELFMKIMALPEYYLTRAELEIFTHQTDSLITKLGVNKHQKFELIELGAGDGTKTIELLKHLSAQNYSFDYIPIDISQHVLDVLSKKIEAALPNVNVKTTQGDYFHILKDLKKNNHQKIVLFLGSNIGNLLDEQARGFLSQLAENLAYKDKLLLGVDRIKSADIVLPAYNDKSGVTRAFNLNLLERINKELGADFDINQFEHTPEYTEEEGVAKSYLTSKKKQKVVIADINKTFYFEKNEKIHMEISRKYNRDVIEEVLHQTHLSIVGELSDSKGYFTDYILEKQNYDT